MFEVIGDVSQRFFKAEPCQQVLIVCILRYRIFFVPFVAEEFTRSVKACSVHHVVQKIVDFLPVLLVEFHRVGVVDEFTYDTQLAPVIEDIGKDAFLIRVFAPFSDDVAGYLSFASVL